MSQRKKKVYLQKEEVKKYTEQRNKRCNVDISFSESSKTNSNDDDFSLSWNGGITDQSNLNSLDLKKHDSSDAVGGSLDPDQRVWDQDSTSFSDFKLPLSPEREELFSDTTRSSSRLSSEPEIVSDADSEPGDGDTDSDHSHPEQYLTSMPVSPVSQMGGPRTPPEPEKSRSTPERIHRRSRTVLYFDSDDDDEGRSHIKESVVLESGSGSEEDSIDNVVVAVCAREESFFDVVATDSTSSAAAAQKSQLMHEDTDLFEILNDVATDQQTESSAQKGNDEVDEAGTSQQTSGEREDENEDSTDGGPKHFSSGTPRSPRKTSLVFMSSSSQVGFSSITKAMKKLYQYMAERKAAQSLPGISPTLEFGRLMPRKRLSILVCTWNMAEGRFLPDNVNRMLFPGPELHSNAQLKEIFIPDVFVVSTQESTAERIEWEVRLQETIGASHVMLLSHHEGVLYMCVFIRRDLLWYVSQTETNFVQTRAGKQFKTKGACAVAFYLFGSSFLFINSHLTPHEHRLNERIRDYSTIIRSLTLPKLLPPSLASNIVLPGGDPESSVPRSEKPLGLSSTAGSKVFKSFDYIVWNGDLNFRINLPYVDVKRLIKSVVNKSPLSPNVSQSLETTSGITDPEAIYAASLQELKKHDQLCQSQKDNLCFAEFQEPEISFLPTYKFDLFSDTYDSSGKRRSPAYTDRILFCGMQKDELNCILYDSCMSLVTSDHKPVVALFEANVDPLTNDLSQKVTPGGGYFERDIYLKAVSRIREKARVCNANPRDSSNLNAIVTRNQNGNMNSGATSHVCVLQ